MVTPLGKNVANVVKRATCFRTCRDAASGASAFGRKTKTPKSLKIWLSVSGIDGGEFQWNKISNYESTQV